jgi:hypothetical protein
MATVCPAYVHQDHVVGMSSSRVASSINPDTLMKSSDE